MCVLVTMHSTDTTMPSDGVRSCQMSQMGRPGPMFQMWFHVRWRRIHPPRLTTSQTALALVQHMIPHKNTLKNLIKLNCASPTHLWRAPGGEHRVEKRNYGKACGSWGERAVLAPGDWWMIALDSQIPNTLPAPWSTILLDTLHNHSNKQLIVFADSLLSMYVQCTLYRI